MFLSIRCKLLIGSSKNNLITQGDNKVEIEILRKCNGNFRFEQLERENWSTPEGRPFGPGNFILIHVSMCISTGRAENFG